MRDEVVLQQLALNKLQHQIGLRIRDTRVQQARDAGMVEPPEQLALAREALMQAQLVALPAQQLDRRLAFE